MIIAEVPCIAACRLFEPATEGVTCLRGCRGFTYQAVMINCLRSDRTSMTLQVESNLVIINRPLGVNGRVFTNYCSRLTECERCSTSSIDEPAAKIIVIFRRISRLQCLIHSSGIHADRINRIAVSIHIEGQYIRKNMCELSPIGILGVCRFTYNCCRYI